MPSATIRSLKDRKVLAAQNFKPRVGEIAKGLLEPELGKVAFRCYKG